MYQKHGLRDLTGLVASVDPDDFRVSKSYKLKKKPSTEVGCQHVTIKVEGVRVKKQEDGAATVLQSKQRQKAAKAEVERKKASAMVKDENKTDFVGRYGPPSAAVAESESEIAIDSESTSFLGRYNLATADKSEVDQLNAEGILPGIKVDKGLVEMWGTDAEKATQVT